MGRKSPSKEKLSPHPFVNFKPPSPRLSQITAFYEGIFASPEINLYKGVFLDKKLLHFFFSSLLETHNVSEERLPKSAGLGRGSIQVPFAWRRLRTQVRGTWVLKRTAVRLASLVCPERPIYTRISLFPYWWVRAWIESHKLQEALNRGAV